MRSYRVWWLIFGLCALAVCAALAWVTAGMLRLERAEGVARAEAEHQSALRLALWRVDSWFAPHLAREAARPYFDYRPFHAPQRAYTRLLHEIEPGEVLTPSPLLNFEPSFIRLHFQLEPDGRISSPQVPTGNLRDLAEGTYLPSRQLEASRAVLATMGALVTRGDVLQCVSSAETEVTRLALDTALASSNTIAPEPRAQSQAEWSRRQKAYAQNTLPPQQLEQMVSPAGRPASAVDVGPLVPFWVTPPSGVGPELLFARRVTVDGLEYLQGFLCDWPKLRDALLGEITDLFPRADLVAMTALGTSGPPSSEMLATVPARLEVAPPLAAGATLSAPTRTTIAVAWLAAIAGLVAVAVTLRASIVFGEKRSRFASAVTHEMRTPLTTFRMYSEMLAEGMVQDPERRQTYLTTLKTESDRLARLVENVLAYARLERGGRRSNREDVTVGALLDRLEPPLVRMAEQADMVLSVDAAISRDESVSVDVEAVAQIVSNLVDNACKYARDAVDRTIHIGASRVGGALAIDVRDHGPGVGAEHARAIFAPFERGGCGPEERAPGIGLGLALSRGLARSLDGDLSLAAAAGDTPGACFRLTLPA